MNTIETIAVILGALGGLEFVKWLFTRHSHAKAMNAEAAGAELKTLKETIIFLQQQLREKEERFADQTQLVRKLNTEIIDGLKERGRLEVELVQVRCNDLPCPFRQPPNAHTSPKLGLTKEEYHANKESL